MLAAVKPGMTAATQSAVVTYVEVGTIAYTDVYAGGYMNHGALRGVPPPYYYGAGNER
jgi:hypothetical protein